jgi:hypothetical protein
MARMPTMCVLTSNDNNIGMRTNKSFDKGVFFFIKAKQTHLIIRKLFLKQNEPVNFNNFKYQAKRMYFIYIFL